MKLVIDSHQIITYYLIGRESIYSVITLLCYDLLHGLEHKDIPCGLLLYIHVVMKY